MTDRKASPEIDENLQSRQLAVYGRQAMGKLSSCRILILGLDGVGAEIAKNVILANVKSVTLQDNQLTTWMDLSSQFYLGPEDIGKNRAEACLPRMQELNSAVDVSVMIGDLSIPSVANFDIVVAVNQALEKNVAINEFCRSQTPTIHFIATNTYGLFASAFVDLGNAFVCTDMNGEQVQTATMADLTITEKGCLVSCIQDERVDFQDGDHVQFTEIQGMDALCTEGTTFEIYDVKAFSFMVKGVTAEHGTYVSGGLATQVKVPQNIQFKDLRSSITSPGEFLESDFSKFDRSRLLHLLFRALARFEEKNGKLPAPCNSVHAASVITYAREIMDDLPQDQRIELDNDASELNFKLCHGARAVLNPMAAIFGGLIGQEVIKAATGKFHPLHQWLYMDFAEAMPSPLPSGAGCGGLNSRYDAQISVFGRSVQTQISNERYFLVGAGALGCELVKNFAMMGLGCGPHGYVSVTDDDTIERSNLTRQFLFRNWMIGQSKSSAAANAVKTMNPEINIKALEDRVSSETEDVFNDQFWNSLTGVCNALDNMKARLYVDSRCVFFNKPLLESGTLGPKCNTQVVLPHVTENYGASADPPEKEAPDCTLHNFPSTINHCLSWGRSEFVGNFSSAPSEANNYIKNGRGIAEGQVDRDVVEKLNAVKAMLSNKPSSFKYCVEWARLKFEDYFCNRIKQLVFTFPKDAVTSSGINFWSPPKRFPTALTFSSEDAEHVRFITAAAVLRAVTCNVPTPGQLETAVKEALATIVVPEFVPSSSAKIDAGDGEDDDDDDEDVDIDTLFNELPASETFKEWRMKPEEFEKDDDTNFHMEFIGAVGNLRGRNYGIKEVDKLQAKLIAGRIIPAIATTTAMATGLVCMELYKVIQKKKLEDFKCSFVNLAIPLFSMMEPMPPKKIISRSEKSCPDPINYPEYIEEEDIVAYPEGHTVWDRLEIKAGDLTVQELINHFKTEHKIIVDSIAILTKDGRGLNLYNALLPNNADRLNKKMTELYKTGSGADLPPKYFSVVLNTTTEMGDSVETPEIVFYYE